MKRIALSSLLTIGLVAPTAATAQACPDPPSDLDGQLSFRGDVWPLRLRVPEAIPAGGESVSGDLDIPDLVMIDRPVSLRCEGGIVVELPFGFGEVTLAADEDGSFVGAKMVGGDSLRLSFEPGVPPPYRTAEVSFQSDGITLAGTLFLPDRPGRHPGIVLVHGSGAQGRHTSAYRSWADFYARRGVAALVYDKRGVGESEGDFEADSAFAGLTADALAAARFLADRPEVVASMVGIGGASQAGWIAYEASGDPAIAFLALFVPPSVSVAEQEVQRVRAGMRAEGWSEDDVAAAVAHTRLLLAVASSGLGWEGLARSVEQARRQEWAEWVHLPDAPQDLRWWRTHAGVHPEDALRALRKPLFAAFSAQDPVVPPAYNAGVLRELAAGSPGADITVVTAPAGDHRLEVSAGRGPDGRWQLPRIARQVTSALSDWIDWRLTGR